MNVHTVAIACICLLIQTLQAQTAPDTSARSITTQEVVVTATRTEHKLETLPLPVTLVDGKQIAATGTVRLNEILSEQTGIAIVADVSGSGSGIQLQGLSSEYVLILLDGEPLVGRTAGTLDLSRFTLRNVQRIEIVRGPSSSLYGSEAMGGVVNIITKQAEQPLLINTLVRYGSNNTLDLTMDAGIRTQRLNATAFVNRYGTSGYTLLPQSGVSTVPVYSNYTLGGKFSYVVSVHTKLGLSGRYFTETQLPAYFITDATGQQRVSGQARQQDYTLNPTFTYIISEYQKIAIRLYSAGYATQAEVRYESTGAVVDESYFTQRFNRAETQWDARWSQQHSTVVGAAYVYETVDASRYTALKAFSSYYAFGQYEWTYGTLLSVVAGARYDKHSQYASQFSPKLSLQIRAAQWLRILGSIGVGFKAPDFRQLYLNFTNPLGGSYSVLGTAEVQSGIALLQQQGQIATLLTDINSLQNIRAESSIAYNLGFDLKPYRNIVLNVNFFRNNIRDLIETLPVAQKTNGQFVYSYTNKTRVVTQGLEANLQWQLSKHIALSAGYQYLDAYDQDVLDQVRSGLIFTRDPVTLASRPVSEAEYGGLLNRSKHSGNVKVFIDYGKTYGSARVLWRSRYGYADLDGNLILNRDDEYVNGFYTVHLTLARRIGKLFTGTVGVDNLFNYLNPQLIPGQPGRLLYVQCQFSLQRTPKN